MGRHRITCTHGMCMDMCMRMYVYMHMDMCMHRDVHTCMDMHMDMYMAMDMYMLHAHVHVHAQHMHVVHVHVRVPWRGSGLKHRHVPGTQPKPVAAAARVLSPRHSPPTPPFHYPLVRTLTAVCMRASSEQVESPRVDASPCSVCLAHRSRIVAHRL